MLRLQLVPQVPYSIWFQISAYMDFWVYLGLKFPISRPEPTNFVSLAYFVRKWGGHNPPKRYSLWGSGLPPKYSKINSAKNF